MDRTDPESTLNEPTTDDEAKWRLLSESKVIAVVGMSPKPGRPANRVAKYFRDLGCTIVPVHPSASEIDGLKVYGELSAIPPEVHVDWVDLFIAPERTLPVVEQAIAMGMHAIWFQPGAENDAAQQRARAAGLAVFSGACAKEEHERLSSR